MVPNKGFDRVNFVGPVTSAIGIEITLHFQAIELFSGDPDGPPIQAGPAALAIAAGTLGAR